jgi:CRISPR-associated protein Csd2
VIDAAVLLTRSAALNPVLKALGFALDKKGQPTTELVAAKYGASTTWMGKLLYRLNAGRNGGCPVLVFGITPKCIEDWEG